MFLLSTIFVFCFLVFWSLYLSDFLSIFFRLAHLAWQKVNKDYKIFSNFCNFEAKSDQNQKWDKRNIHDYRVVCLLFMKISPHSTLSGLLLAM